jgi:DNA-binding MarR family transcriptional regulator
MKRNRGSRKPGADGSRLTPAEHAHRSLLRAFGSLKKVMESYFARFGISRPQWAVLIVLHRSEEEGGGLARPPCGGMRLRDLGERLFIRPPSVTGVVDRLEREGLVARSKAEDDLRVRRVRLTDTGRAMIRRVLAVHAEEIRTIMSGLSAQQQTMLARLLDQLDAHLKTFNAEAGGARRAPGAQTLER